MKIKKENQFGLNFTGQMRDFFVSNQSKIIQSYPLHNYYTGDVGGQEFSIREKAESQIRDLASDSDNKNYLFTDTAKSVCEKIKVDKFRASALKTTVGYKKITFLVGKDRFYRVVFNNSEIIVLLGRLISVPNSTDYRFTYSTFKIFPELDTVDYPENPEDYLQDEFFVEFLRLLIFFEYSETTLTELKPKGKIGTKREGKFLNESSQNVTIVDSNWNNIVVRTQGFGVSGHYRLQPCGKDLSDRKLIYIAEFAKKGYVRGAKKEVSTFA